MKLALLGFFLSLLAVSIAARGATYTYTFSIGTPTLTSSTSESLPVYLHEASSDSSSQINIDGGLYSFGLTASVTAGPGTISNLVRNPAFDSLVTTAPNASTTSFPTAQAKLYAQQDINFLNGVTVDASGNAVLATIYFSNVSGVTTFTLFDINTIGSQTVDYNSRALDPSATTSVTIAAPEPCTLAMLMLAIPIAGRRRRRRWR